MPNFGERILHFPIFESERIFNFPNFNKLPKFILMIYSIFLQKCCGIKGNRDVLFVKPSVLWFAHYVSVDKQTVQLGTSTYRTCLSMHCSYSELCGIVQYLKPSRIVPLEDPPKSTKAQVTVLFMFYYVNILRLFFYGVGYSHLIVRWVFVT